MVILGLGSNIGDRAAYLTQAIAALHPLFSDLCCSPVYESVAVLPEGAPAEWNMPYLNMAVAGKTTLSPAALLVEIKRIEAALGRKRRGHWSPREIDIDILAYGDQVMNTEILTLPHKALLERDFAIIPFADIAPDWMYPAGEHKGIPARKLAERRTSTLARTDIVIA